MNTEIGKCRLPSADHFVGLEILRYHNSCRSPAYRADIFVNVDDPAISISAAANAMYGAADPDPASSETRATR